MPFVLHAFVNPHSIFRPLFPLSARSKVWQTRVWTKTPKRAQSIRCGRFANPPNACPRLICGAVCEQLSGLRCLQVISCRDVSAPTDSPGSGEARTLGLQLSDGFVRVQAIEYTRCKALPYVCLCVVCVL
jgi:hypothetical protein